MAETPKRLVGPTGLITVSSTVYTVPAATTTVVRNIHAASVGTGIYTFSLAINGPSSTPTNAWHYQTQLPPFGALDWSGNLVLTAGEYLMAHCSNANLIVLTITGVELT